MKKLLVLMVLVVAMVATPVFAEITQDGWAGDFTYKIGGNFKDAAMDSVGNDLDLSMSAMVGEYTTFSVGLGGAFTGVTTGGSTEMTTAGVLSIDTIEMTQDFSSLVGNDITLKMTVGTFNLEVTEYETIDLTGQTDSATANNVKFTFGTAGITVNAIVSPTSLTNDKFKKMAVEAIYASDMIWVNAAYVNAGVEKGVVEGGLKVVVADLTVTGMMNANLDTEVQSAYAGLQYVMAPITAKAAFLAPDLKTVADTAKAAVGVDFAATDMITLKAGATIPFADTANTMGVDGAVCMKVDTVEYKLGVAYQDSTYAAAYDAADIDATLATKVAVSFQMDVDF